MKNKFLLISLIFIKSTIAQVNTQYIGEIKYYISSGTSNNLKHIQTYNLLFNDSIIKYNVTTPGSEDIIKNAIKANLVKENPNIDSFELERKVKLLTKSVDDNTVKSYYFYKLKKYGISFDKNGEKYLGLSPMLSTDSLHIELTNDTCTILGLKCQRFIVKYKKEDWSYWVSTKVPVSINTSGLNVFPGITLKIENSSKTYVAMADKLEYPIKDKETEQFNFKNVITLTEAHQWMNKKSAEAQAEVKKYQSNQ